MLGDSDDRMEISTPGTMRAPIPFCVGMIPCQQKNTADKMELKSRLFHDHWRNAQRYFWRYFFPRGTYCTTSVTRPDHREDLKPRIFWDQWRRVFRGRAVLFVGPTIN